MSEKDRNANNTQNVCVGRISGVRGIKGEVRIKSFTEDPADLTAYGPLHFEDGSVVTLKNVQVLKGEVVARLGGIDSRDKAEALKGTELFAARDKFPEPDEGEFYYDQLVGLQVRNKEGQAIGEVIGMQDYGAGDVVEVKIEGQKQTLLLPFTADCVPVVEIGQGYVVVEPPGVIEADDAQESNGES